MNSYNQPSICARDKRCKLFSLLSSAVFAQQQAPLTIRVLDKRAFDLLPVVGTHVVKSVKDFLVVPVMSAEQSAALMV